MQFPRVLTIYEENQPIMSARRVHRTIFVLMTGTILAFCLLVALGLTAGHTARADEPKTGDIVVQFDDSATVVRPILFTAPISGTTALNLSGLTVVISETGFGPFVCAIQGVGCPVDDCFCQCTDDASCRYWDYRYWDGDAWQSYPTGVGSTVISSTGAIEGWHWGEFGEPMTPADQTIAARKALAALTATQADNGGFGSPSGSVETLLAVGANQQSSRSLRRSATAGTLFGYLLQNAWAYTDAGGVSPASVAKLATAAAATDTCWPATVVTPNSFFSPTLGAYSIHPGINIWAILGALAHEEPVPAAAVAAVKSAIQPTGGWRWMDSFDPDTNTTALAIQALVGAGEPLTATEVISGLLYLQRAQNDDGGFSYDPDAAEKADSDTNSTAYAVQALLAAGEDPRDPTWTINGNTPIQFLLTTQLADGTFAWKAGGVTSPLATMQAIPALLGQSFPLAQGVARCPAIFVPEVNAPE